MKQENTSVFPTDFLTKQGFDGQVPQQVQPIQMEAEELELHKESQFITRDRKAEIDAEVAKAISKENLAEERLQTEAELIKKKHEGSPSHPRDILKELLVKGELRKTFEVFGHRWTLRALDQGDLLLAMDDLKDSIETEAGRLVAVVFSKVVYSIEAIDDIPIYDFFPEIQPTNYPSKIDYIIAVKRFLRSYLVGMPPVVIDTLYIKYDEVERERDQAVTKLKNS
jgi:hypothetical protein